MSMQAYSAPPPDGMGTYLTGRGTGATALVDTTNSLEQFHTDHLLDARLDDCGRPDEPRWHRTELYERKARSGDDEDTTQFHRGRRFAYCPDGHLVKLDLLPNRAGYHFRHWPGDTQGTGDCRFDTPIAESSEHRELKTATASAFRRAGATARTERKTVSKRSQPDITVELPDERRLAIEIQLSDIGGGGVAARRNRYLREDGLDPVWLVPAGNEVWSDRVPSLTLATRTEGGAREQVVLVWRIVYSPCRERRCWYRRWSGKTTCPGHYTTSHVLSAEDEDEGREHRDNRLTLERFADMLTNGELEQVHLPQPGQSYVRPVVTYADDDAILARAYADRYDRLRHTRQAQQERPVERLPYCPQRKLPRDPTVRDRHGEWDAWMRPDGDVETARPDREPVAGEWVSIWHADTQQPLTARVHRVEQDPHGIPTFGVRFWHPASPLDGIQSRPAEDWISMEDVIEVGVQPPTSAL